MDFLEWGTVWFWIAFAVAFICFIWATEKGSGVGATATLIITLAAFYFFGNKMQTNCFFMFCSIHKLMIVVLILGYIILGIAWAIVKWYSYLIKQRNEIKEELKHHTRSTVYVPLVSEYKSKILTWMFYWPFSSLWTLIDDPVKRMYLFIYRNIAAFLQNMANRVFAPLTEEQRKLEEDRQRLAEQRSEQRRREITEM
jgi:hypothetical protein